MSRRHGANKPLLAQHRADLERSGLSEETIRGCGFYSETDPEAVAQLLGWTHPAKGLGPCLCIPYTGPGGTPTGYVRVKPDRPRERGGKRVKYESPVRQPNRAYFPPGVRSVLLDPAVPLLVTEGEKKAARADQDGFRCVGLVGVNGFQKKRETGPDGRRTGRRELIDDLATVPWRGRRVTIVYDSDAAEKEPVQRAERHLADALRAEGAEVRVIRLPPGPGGAKVGLDDFLVANGPDQLRRLIDSAGPVPSAVKTVRRSKSEKPPSAADQLVGIGLRLDLWHDATQAGYVTVKRNSHAIRSRAFRQYLVHEFRKQTGRVPNSEALAAAVNAIEAAAVCDGPQDSAHVRIAGHGGAVYLSLADAESTVIEIDAAGWRVCPNPPVRFRRPPGMLPLPMPRPGGRLADLRRFLNVPDDATFALVAAWLTGCFRPDGPFPALVLLGEQGTAKTTTARVVRKLIDPNAAPVRSEPKDARDLMIQARGGWVLVLDNLSGLSGWFSDALCRLATGGGFSTRGLYSDDDEVIFDAKRPLVINGIEDFVTRPDLLERSLLIRHPRIEDDERRSESELWTAFDAAHPVLLGALLDRVAGGLRELSRVRPDRLSRMADFELFAAACEKGAGGTEAFFSMAYAENRAGAGAQALDSSPLTEAILKLMADDESPQHGSRNGGEYTGSPTALLNDLARHVPDPRPRDWPKAANVLTNKLKRLAPSLRQVHGLDVDCEGRASGGRSEGARTRQVRITHRADSGREEAFQSSPAAHPAIDPGLTCIPIPRVRPGDGPDEQPRGRTVPPAVEAQLQRNEVISGPRSGGDDGDGLLTSLSTGSLWSEPDVVFSDQRLPD